VRTQLGALFDVQGIRSLLELDYDRDVSSRLGHFEVSSPRDPAQTARLQISRQSRRSSVTAVTLPLSDGGLIVNRRRVCQLYSESARLASRRKRYLTRYLTRVRSAPGCHHWYRARIKETTKTQGANVAEVGAPFADDSRTLHRYYASCASSRTVFAVIGKDRAQSQSSHSSPRIPLAAR